MIEYTVFFFLPSCNHYERRDRVGDGDLDRVGEGANSGGPVRSSPASDTDDEDDPAEESECDSAEDERDVRRGEKLDRGEVGKRSSICSFSSIVDPRGEFTVVSRAVGETIVGDSGGAAKMGDGPRWGERCSRLDRISVPLATYEAHYENSGYSVFFNQNKSSGFDFDRTYSRVNVWVKWTHNASNLHVHEQCRGFTDERIDPIVSPQSGWRDNNKLR